MIWFGLILFSLCLIFDNIVSCENNFEDENKPLILTPFIESSETLLARNLSKVDLDGFENVVSYSGYFTVNPTYNSNLFFWFIQSENDYLKDPVLLWLHGGPGFPSEAGLFGESGPVTVKNGTPIPRDNSWTKSHSIIYIDNPVGTGFSFTDNDDGYAVDQDQIGEELYKALIQFFALFPELQRNDFFLAGGSYAGKYIPAVAHFIHKNNPKEINLKGAIIYSGIVDPINQLVFADFLSDRGLIEDQEKIKLQVLEDLIAKLINMDMHEISTVLWNVLVMEIKGNPKVVNIYNYPNKNDYYTSIPDWIPYIISPETMKKLHVGNTSFNFNIADPNNKVRKLTESDWTKSVAPWFKELVDHYPVLLFSGDLDAMVPYTSVSNFISKLNSSVSYSYNQAKRYLWKVNDEIAGECKPAGFLTECIVWNSGHSVPHEKDRYSYDLVYKFTRNNLSFVEDENDDYILTKNNTLKNQG